MRCPSRREQSGADSRFLAVAPKLDTIIQVAVLLIVAVLPGRGVQAQDAPAARLQSQLQAQFKLASIGSDVNGVQILEPGTVLVIQKGGLLGVVPTSAIVCAANFKDNNLQTPGGLCKAMVTNYSRFLQSGEKVYPTKIAVDLKKERISISVIECDSCNGVTQPSSYKSEVAFQFPKGYLEGADVGQVGDVINQVFTSDTGNADTQQQTPAPQEAPAPDAPAEAPPPAAPAGVAAQPHASPARPAPARVAPQPPAAPVQSGTSVRDTILYRIFDKYPYNTKKPFAMQYPRIALTVISGPPNHAHRQQQEYGGGFVPENGCWTLRAKVWSSDKDSQDVGPFQWCSPRDLPKDFQPANVVTIVPCDGCAPQQVPKNTPAGSELAAQRGVRNRLLYVAGASGGLFANWLDHSQNYAVGADTSGSERTDGPIPPDVAVPSDPAHARYFASNTGVLDITSNDGGMVLLMFDTMDVNLTIDQDRRVWIVRFLPATE
jgi:hypothetical protein